VRGKDKKKKKLKAIKAGFEETLGIEGSFLVFKTLKLVYRMNEDDIVSNPDRFEDVIRRLFGPSAEVIFKAIAKSESESGSDNH
jgi:hypothetical protein